MCRVVVEVVGPGDDEKDDERVISDSFVVVVGGKDEGEWEEGGGSG